MSVHISRSLGRAGVASAVVWVEAVTMERRPRPQALSFFLVFFSPISPSILRYSVLFKPVSYAIKRQQFPLAQMLPTPVEKAPPQLQYLLL